jgi:hypothetical protein
MLQCDILAPAQNRAFSGNAPYLLFKSLNFRGFFGDSDRWAGPENRDGAAG